MKNQLESIHLLPIIALLGIFSLTACEFNVSTSSGNTTLSQIETVQKSAEKIRNQIQFEEKGVKVEAAFLMLDNGDLVPENNTIKAGEKFKLILKLSGWQATNGMVQLGAGEQLTNSNQAVMMYEEDLFANAGAISEEDAQYITLDMEVLNTQTLYDFYQTDFRVWNKNGNQQVDGSYRFKLEK